MRSAAILLSSLLLAGCAASVPSGSSPSPATGFALRAWISQALPPVGAFGAAGPLMAIADGRLIVHGPQVAIYPGPLLPNLQERPISDAGIAAILTEARRAGLLDGPTDLTGGSPPGAQTAHLLFTIDGVEREVLGDPGRQINCITTPCEAPAGTPEAFGGFWSRLLDLPGWLGSELGAETPHAFTRLAVLVLEPTVDATIPPTFAAWPLVGALAEFGVPFGGQPPVRCGIIEGTDLEPALEAFRAANQLTRWHDRGETQYGLVLRPLFPAEPDPCTGGG